MNAAPARRERPRSRTTSLLVAPLFLMTTRIITAEDPLELRFVLGYFLLYVGMISAAQVWSANNPTRPNLLRVEGFALQRIRGLLFGIGLVLAVFLVLWFFARPSPREIPWTLKAALFVDMVLIVATVEEFAFRWTGPKIADPSGTRRSVLAAMLLMQGVFAFLHEPVRTAWLDLQFTSASIAFFLYAFLIGVFLWVVVDPRFAVRVLFDRPLNLSAFWRSLFGFGTAVGIHGALNAVIVLYELRIGDLVLEPLGIGPWAAIAMALLVSARSSSWRSSASSSSSSCSPASSRSAASTRRSTRTGGARPAPEINPRRHPPENSSTRRTTSPPGRPT